MQSSEAKSERRNFLKRAATGVVTATTLTALNAHAGWMRDTDRECRGESNRKPRHGKPGRGYGPLNRMRDQNGQEILALPAGFSYITFSKTGEMMSDGFPTPAVHDGMTCFETRHGTLRLIRNHELRNAAGDFALGVVGPEATRYDARAAGGCVTLDFDPRYMQFVRAFTSLNGTLVNCSGGLAYKDVGWISCEETTNGVPQGYAKPHGYSFLVRKDIDYPELAQPLTAMGRFAKEAAVADNESGIVYQTEDSGGNSGFYRFLPNDPTRLAAGGALQMLKIRGASNYDTRTNQTVDAELAVEWVSIDVPDPATLSASASCFGQGFAKGGARFNRLEGIFRGDDGSIYFASTSGGNAGVGQLWQFIPSYTGGGTLVLVYESPASLILDSPDNICITPSGGVLFCEDDASNDNDTHVLAPGFTNINRLIGLSRDGQPFEFAVNVFSDSEFAGACFSPDGNILFVNIQGTNAVGSGMTCAIWGPWRRGPL